MLCLSVVFFIKIVVLLVVRDGGLYCLGWCWKKCWFEYYVYLRFLVDVVCFYGCYERYWY